jgi:hypothetical protein
VRILCVGVFLIVSAVAHAQDSITIREASKNNFVGTLVSDRELSIEDAQGKLLANAAATCRDRVPHFGRYTFESTKQVPAAASATDRFKFKQAFSCEERALERLPPASATVISEEEQQRLVNRATDETRNLIDPADERARRAIHAMFSPELSAMVPLTQWLEQQEQMHRNSGAMTGTPLLKTTTYIDPPDSPGPGVYVAVDFQAKYENVPFRCGYVIWLFDQQSHLSVLRIEDGIIYNKDAAGMTAEALEQTKQQFRCFSP